jgi:hypothetical protein
MTKEEKRLLCHEAVNLFNDVTQRWRNSVWKEPFGTFEEQERLDRVRQRLYQRAQRRLNAHAATD